MHSHVPDLREKLPCSKHLNFHSQPLPEATGEAGFSQGTLHDTLQQALDPKEPKKAEKKRFKKSKITIGASNSQHVSGDKIPKRVCDKMTIPNWHRSHELAKPMLPDNVLGVVRPEIKSVHDKVLLLEKELIKENNPSYPLFPGKVPMGMGFVDIYPGDVFFVRYSDIFDMFHMKPLPPSMVRLFVLNLAQQLIREN